MLSLKENALTQQLQDQQIRIEELQQIQKSAQANLEHYRNETREQRLLEQHQFEGQKQYYLAEIKTLQNECHEQDATINSIKQRSL